MHTTDIGAYKFIHNGDFSGDVHIQQVKHPERQLRIPFYTLKQFVADYVRANRIEVIEQASDDEILGVK